MKILLLGASGMVGQGVLRECLAAADVTEMVSLVRAPTGVRDPKLREIVLADFRNLGTLEASLRDLTACFYCAGVSSFRMTESDYSALTYDLTVGVASTLCGWNPGLTLIYVSGAGTDSTERGRSMWARVKGRTENALLALPCRAYMFRPGIIRPADGIVSKTAVYRFIYAFLSPVTPLLERALPDLVTNTRQVGRAMLGVARHGNAKRVLETRDINAP
jgi:uncharacterized protein YbjT (DUF2867 family)